MVKQLDKGHRASGWQSLKTVHLRMKEASTPPAGMSQLTARPPARQPPDDHGSHIWPQPQDRLSTVAHWVKVKVTQSCLTLWDPHGLYSPWNSPGQNTGVACLFSRGSSRPRNRTRSPALQADSLPTELSGKAGPLTSCPNLLLRNWEDGK